MSEVPHPKRRWRTRPTASELSPAYRSHGRGITDRCSSWGRDGRSKWKAGLVELSILQEVGFLYEDEEGQPINLDEIPKDQRVKYDAVYGGKALCAIPVTNGQGNVIRNKDGTARRRLANGVTWRFASRFADPAKNRETSWVSSLELCKSFAAICRSLAPST